jgi:Fe-S cluster biogenesis protein NfuA
LSLKETMAQDTEFQQRIQRIGAMVSQLESTADPSSRKLAKDLVESLMALHGAGIERILEITSEAGDPGLAIIDRCGRDELVSSLLLLYGFHPDDLQTRVLRALEKSQVYLASQHAHAELAAITEDGVVTVRLEVKAGGCGSSAVKSTLDGALQDAAPDATSIVVEEAGASLTRSGFVSVTQLAGGLAIAASPIAEQVQRSGD